MLHEIKTTNESELFIKKVETFEVEDFKIVKKPNEIFIFITNKKTGKTSEVFITKQSAMELANKLLSIATIIK